MLWQYHYKIGMPTNPFEMNWTERERGEEEALLLMENKSHGGEMPEWFKSPTEKHTWHRKWSEVGKGYQQDPSDHLSCAETTLTAGGHQYHTHTDVRK